MFESWREYRDYLLEHLIDNPEWRGIMGRRFARNDRDYGEVLGPSKYQMQIRSILTHDWEGIKWTNYIANPQPRRARVIVKEEQAKANV